MKLDRGRQQLDAVRTPRCRAVAAEAYIRGKASQDRVVGVQDRPRRLRGERPEEIRYFLDALVVLRYVQEDRHFGAVLDERSVALVRFHHQKVRTSVPGI